jgi:hypothetical protein
MNRGSDMRNTTREELEAGLFASLETTANRHSIIFNLLLALLFFCISLFGFAQTEKFVSLLPHPSKAEIRASMEKATAEQRQIMARYGYVDGQEPHATRMVSNLFTDEDEKRVHIALYNLLRDEKLNEPLRHGLGVRLRNVTAVIVPYGYDAAQLGLTEDGRRLLTSTGELNLSGMTIRDVDSARQLTSDGRPRIILFDTAFYSEKTLRLTLFHELLHASNVPGHTLSPFTFLQDDLTYLPEYRFALKERGFRKWNEFYIWLFGVVLPLVYAGYCAFRLFVNIKAYKLRKLAISN